jgi:hypothetical protein
MAPSEDDGQTLKQQVDSAHEAYRIAAAKYTAVLNDVPSGLPHPDGATRVRKASEEVRRALGAYSQAVQRLSVHILSRNAPKEP